MPGWYSVVCKECSTEFAVHDDWSNVPTYCKDCLWHDVLCEICKTPMRVRRDWAHPPRVHKECRDAEMAKWTEKPCKGCGTPLKVHRDWHHPPTLCKTCKVADDEKWAQKPCKSCGVSMKVRSDWRNPPIYCKTCKVIEDAKWSERPCKLCGQPLRVNSDWKNPPDYHDHCAWSERPCDICGEPLRVHRSWSKGSRAHKACLAEYAPKVVSCADCATEFTIATAVQLRCREKGWDLPRRCESCKLQFKHIQVALSAVRDQYRFALVARFQEQGELIDSRVAVVSSRKTGDRLAEVQVSADGLVEDVRIFPKSAATVAEEGEAERSSGEEEAIQTPSAEGAAEEDVEGEATVRESLDEPNPESESAAEEAAQAFAVDFDAAAYSISYDTHIFDPAVKGEPPASADVPAHEDTLDEVDPESEPPVSADVPANEDPLDEVDPEVDPAEEPDHHSDLTTAR